jgi:activator of 2-hydroxyglutaryl-CoA dehydratase
MAMKFIGLDAGSVSVKLVILDEKGNNLYSHYERHKGHPVNVALESLRAVSIKNSLKSNKDNSFSLSITGSAGRLIASILGIEPVNEIVAHAYSTHKLLPSIKTIIEMGGEDSKLILLGKDGRSVKDFSMKLHLLKILWLVSVLQLRETSRAPYPEAGKYLHLYHSREELQQTKGW